MKGEFSSLVLSDRFHSRGIAKDLHRLSKCFQSGLEQETPQSRPRLEIAIVSPASTSRSSREKLVLASAAVTTVFMDKHNSRGFGAAPIAVNSTWQAMRMQNVARDRIMGCAAATWTGRLNSRPFPGHNGHPHPLPLCQSETKNGVSSVEYSVPSTQSSGEECFPSNNRTEAEVHPTRVTSRSSSRSPACTPAARRRRLRAWHCRSRRGNRRRSGGP